MGLTLNKSRASFRSQLILTLGVGVIINLIHNNLRFT